MAGARNTLPCTFAHLCAAVCILFVHRCVSRFERFVLLSPGIMELCEYISHANVFESAVTTEASIVPMNAHWLISEALSMMRPKALLVAQVGGRDVLVPRSCGEHEGHALAQTFRASSRQH